MISLISIVNLFALFNFVSSCYIINCPLGTKRDAVDDNVRYCRTCANGLGMCFGPRICCGPDIGCLLDTKVSQICESEDVKYSTPCLPYGKACTRLPFGKCATKNLCCNPESCLFDESCNENDIVKFMDLTAVEDSGLISTKRDEKKIREKLKLALKHLLHNTKQKRVEFPNV